MESNAKIVCIHTESERVRKLYQFETVKYGETTMNETFDIYGIDLPKGIDYNIFLFNNFTFFDFRLVRFSIRQISQIDGKQHTYT